MRVDLRAGDEVVFAQYDSFRVDSAADYYRLHLEGYHGTAGRPGPGGGVGGAGDALTPSLAHPLGDSMSYHSGSVFSARDRDPNNLLISCAVSYRGAWWYRNCHYANLNGLYGSTVDHQVRAGQMQRAWLGLGCLGVAGPVTEPSGPSSVKRDSNVSPGAGEEMVIGWKGSAQGQASALCSWEL